VRVHVTLRGTLSDRLPGGRGELEVSEGASVGALAAMLDLPGRQCVFVVNGSTVKPDAELHGGDRVQAFPPMAGGAWGGAGHRPLGRAIRRR
jgi:sulfur carrier protein ThiS